MTFHTRELVSCKRRSIAYGNKEVFNVRHFRNHYHHSRRRGALQKDDSSAAELVNGFVALAQESGEWLYFAPGDVNRFRFTPVKAEEKPKGDVQSYNSSENELVASGVSQDVGSDVPDEKARTVRAFFSNHGLSQKVKDTVS